ncbi:unnamed protein product, partial [Notodromas monacha]
MSYANMDEEKWQKYDLSSVKIVSSGASIFPRSTREKVERMFPNLAMPIFQLTAAAITEDGWYRTGDFGYFNNNHCLLVLDRVKDLIHLSSGEIVAPSEIDDLIIQHESVFKVGVAGVKCGHENRPRAFVVLKKNAPPIEPEDIVKFVEDAMKFGQRSPRDVLSSLSDDYPEERIENYLRGRDAHEKCLVYNVNSSVCLDGFPIQVRYPMDLPRPEKRTKSAKSSNRKHSSSAESTTRGNHVMTALRRTGRRGQWEPIFSLMRPELIKGTDQKFFLDVHEPGSKPGFKIE